MEMFVIGLTLHIGNTGKSYLLYRPIKALFIILCITIAFALLSFFQR